MDGSGFLALSSNRSQLAVPDAVASSSAPPAPALAATASSPNAAGTTRTRGAARKWNQEEREKFRKCFERYGEDLEKYQPHIPTRSFESIRGYYHATKKRHMKPASAQSARSGSSSKSSHAIIVLDDDGEDGDVVAAAGVREGDGNKKGKAKDGTTGSCRAGATAAAASLTSGEKREKRRLSCPRKTARADASADPQTRAAAAGAGAAGDVENRRRQPPPSSRPKPAPAAEGHQNPRRCDVGFERAIVEREAALRREAKRGDKAQLRSPERETTEDGEAPPPQQQQKKRKKKKKKVSTAIPPAPAKEGPTSSTAAPAAKKKAAPAKLKAKATPPVSAAKAANASANSGGKAKKLPVSAGGGTPIVPGSPVVGSAKDKIGAAPPHDAFKAKILAQAGRAGRRARSLTERRNADDNSAETTEGPPSKRRRLQEQSRGPQVHQVTAAAAGFHGSPAQQHQQNQQGKRADAAAGHDPSVVDNTNDRKMEGVDRVDPTASSTASLTSKSSLGKIQSETGMSSMDDQATATATSTFRSISDASSSRTAASSSRNGCGFSCSSSPSSKPNAEVAAKPVSTVAARSTTKTAVDDSSSAFVAVPGGPSSHGPVDSMCDGSKEKVTQHQKPTAVPTVVTTRSSNRNVAPKNLNTPTAAEPTKELTMRKRDVKAQNREKGSRGRKPDANADINRIDVGSRVYAKWPDNGEWYVGKCTKVKRQPQLCYSVEFDDGDFQPSIPEGEIVTWEVYTNQQRDTLALAQTAKGCACTCKCPMCSRPPCLRCHPCRSEDPSKCFQKMCQMKKEDNKAVDAVTFPRGWKFVFQYFNEENKPSTNIIRQTNGLVILAPNGRRYYSVEAAKTHNPVSLSTVNVEMFKLYTGHPDDAKSLAEESVPPDNSDAHSAASTVSSFTPEAGLASKQDQSILSHPLMGVNFVCEWIDAKNRPLHLLGKVSACQKDQDNCLRFIVRYEDVTCKVANAAVLEFGSSIPPCVTLSEGHVHGGCQLFAERASQGLYPKGKALPSCASAAFKWRVPQAVVDQMVEEQPGTLLPRRTLLFRGYQLIFQVKQSLIPNAGYGVFVSCRPCLDSIKEDLVLQPGECIDFGVYAPLQKEDRSPEYITLIKNFIHDWSCDCYNFNVAPHEGKVGGWGKAFDISDDITGDLHEMAQQSVLPYVNEPMPGVAETVYAEHDPSGAVHYLLGHYNQDHGVFTLPADGQEVEIHVNYGDDYEKIRLRKGYPRCDEEMQRQYWKEMEEDKIDIVTEDSHDCVLGFKGKEMADVVDFLKAICVNPDVFPEEKRIRILLIALLLRERSVTLEEEQRESSDKEQIALCQNSGQNIKCLIPELVWHWWKTNEKSLSASLLKPDRIILEGLTRALRCKDSEELSAMTPNRLMERVVGSTTTSSCAEV